MSDMPAANTTVPVNSPTTVAQAAMIPIPMPVNVSANVADVRAPNRSGMRAPKIRMHRMRTP